jgi:hypothetical protein
VKKDISYIRTRVQELQCFLGMIEDKQIAVGLTREDLEKQKSYEKELKKLDLQLRIAKFNDRFNDRSRGEK